jgi:high-affinity K+ transport system ATPase subunit B
MDKAILAFTSRWTAISLDSCPMRVMLTGDNAIVARSVGRRLGLSGQFAEMLPSDKAEVIREFQRNGNIVAIVGDGIPIFPTRRKNSAISTRA